MSKNKWIDVVICAAILGILLFMVYGLNQEEYYLVSLCIIALVLIPFFVRYERETKLREIMIIIVMSGVGIVSRVAFFMLPQVKPLMALVIITGVSMGRHAGFATGALAAFVSNFYFGQGPHTPFQMVAMGTAGYLAGLFFNQRKNEPQRLTLALFGFVCGAIIYAAIVDAGTILMIEQKPNWSLVLATYGVGIPMDLIHGISTAIFIFVLYRPVCKQLKRIQKKYGLYL